VTWEQLVKEGRTGWSDDERRGYEAALVPCPRGNCCGA